MKRRLRNVTITLEEAAVRWARLEAARRETSVSRLLGSLIEQLMRKDDAYDAAMKRALARKPFLRSDRPYPSREEIHDRARFR